MKTNHLLLMAITALLTASCSQNEIMEVSPDAAPAVGFNVYATAQTRGTITDNETTNTGIKNTIGFGVLAYYTGQSAWSAAAASTAPNFMYNQQVEWDATLNSPTGAWKYTPVKYWPNTEGDKISFFAYAPYSDQKTSPKPSGITLSGNTANDKGAPTLKFTLQTDATKLVDLVATNATGVHAPTGASKVIDITKSTDAVKFKFDHVLTRLNFKAKLDATPASETHIFVTGMRLLGNGNNNGTTLYSSATYKFADGKWDYTTATPTAQSTDYSVNAIMPLANQTGVVTGYNTQGIKITASGNNLLKTTPTPAHYLFLIPPTDATGVVKDKVKVQIDYDIVTVDPNIAIGYSITRTKATVSLPEGTMARGKAYDYLFTIGLEKVQISATVEPWGTATNTPIPSANAANNVTAITTAIGTLNTAKGSNPNCNYFVVNVTGGAIPTTLNISSATVGNFVSGDKIEIISTSASSVTLTAPSGWKRISATGNANNLIIQKN